jgi:hypothetical protein
MQRGEKYIQTQPPTNGATPHANGKAPATRKSPRPIECYFDLSRGRYYYQLKNGDWIAMSEESFGRILRAVGFTRDGKHDNSLSYLEQELVNIQLERGVSFAGELAGYGPGETVIEGKRCLITRGPRIPEPKPGRWPLLDKFFSQLLGGYKAEFFAWVKCARQALRAGAPWRPGQIAVFAGPAGCGKNLCQSIITEILGGRAAKPYRYMIGETSFNRELMGAEHLVIQDESPLADWKARRIFGARVKDFVVNEMQSCHAKGFDAVTLTPFWRLSISLNEEPENLQILPPLDESLVDKLSLFRCFPTKLPFDGSDPRNRKIFRERLSAELPAFLGWLQKWKIPPRLKDQRFGCAAHLDPHLVQEIDSLSPEVRMWSLIEAGGFLPLGPYGWEGSAIELEKLLRDKFPAEAARLLHYSTACGVYLARLAGKAHLRECIKRRRGDENRKEWVLIHPRYQKEGGQH